MITQHTILLHKGLRPHVLQGDAVRGRSARRRSASRLRLEQNFSPIGLIRIQDNDLIQIGNVIAQVLALEVLKLYNQILRLKPPSLRPT